MPFSHFSRILFILCLTLGGLARAGIITSDQLPHKVFVFYMPNWPVHGIDPASTYWYTEPFDPAKDNAGGLSARPIFYRSTGKGDNELEGLIAEIRLAKQMGVDGFIVDQLEDQPNYLQRWKKLLQAAEIVRDFTISLSPNYVTLWPNGTNGAPLREKVKHWLDEAKNSPALFRFQGRPVLFPYNVGYSEGKNADGTLTAETEKRDLVDWLASQGQPVHYVAAHSVDWGIYDKPFAKDPQKGFQTFALGAGSFTPMMAEWLYDRPYNYWPSDFPLMGEVAFIYYNRHWRYSSSTLSYGYQQRWKWNIDRRDRVRWLWILTWNDWGESAIAPSVNHYMAWVPLTRYYADWFKKGTPPAIERDWVALFHRPHPFAAQPTRNAFQMKGEIWTTKDEVEAVALLTAPATLVISTGDQETRSAVGAGIQRFVTAFRPGVQRAWLERNGQMLCQVTTPVPVHTAPGRQNFWFIAADSDHLPRTIPALNWRTSSGNWTRSGDVHTGRGLSIVGDARKLGNYQVRAMFTPSATAAGVALRVWGDHHYRFTVQQEGGALRWKIVLNRGSTVTVLKEGTTTAAAGPVQVRFAASGEYLSGYVNNAWVGTCSDWTMAFGQAGLYSEGQTTFEFSEAAVKSFDLDIAEFHMAP